MSASDRGLDSAFLRYIGYDPVPQRAHQLFYTRFYVGCRRVVDLGCGSGDFVELLSEQNVAAVGVDADPDACQSMLERGLDVVNQDVFDYLGEIPAASIDGVFASHLVEHQPYEKVLELVRLAYRALEPGGAIVLTTPDPRSLYAHLEMFYLHFGHITFYDPRLLGFFLEHVGFDQPESGSNTSRVQPDSPLFGLNGMHSVQANRLPLWKDTVWRRGIRAVRVAIARVLLNPYLDLIDANFRRLQAGLDRIDRPFECYVKANKPRSVPDREGTA